LWHGAGWTFIIWGALHGFYLMVNHAWRGFKAKMGWGEGGRLAKLGAGALTFLAVVVGWVFFRADSFTSAMTMLHGMAGMNGVSLPSSLEGKIGHYLAGYDWITFQGLHPMATGFDMLNALIIFCLAFPIIWLLPNVWQIFQTYRPTCEDLKEHRPATDASLAPAQQEKWLRLFQWRPTKIRALATGVLFSIAIMGLTRVSEFLYFQF
jgi:D-alanyl-lipoteichoic acid acyltransferase DltB (MBOAT superfamily)